MSMKSLTIFIISALFISGCTPYRSADRKNFESDYSPQALSKTQTIPSDANLENESCRMIGKLESWVLEEFPASNYELLLADEEIEVWKTFQNSKILIKSFQKVDKKIRHCSYTFESELEWQSQQALLLNELEATLVHMK